MWAHQTRKPRSARLFRVWRKSVVDADRWHGTGALDGREQFGLQREALYEIKHIDSDYFTED
ncbi:MULTISPECIES: hypothetical protein [unclassified Pseudomonas]|uniref:hypothetical protein n=1 Tax=unclassified Pseudomonas TaxID=196821 RepID=UPI0010329D27|nr:MULTISPECIES: hypothetical protein [unclassified Pseudomonas]